MAQLDRDFLHPKDSDQVVQLPIGNLLKWELKISEEIINSLTHMRVGVCRDFTHLAITLCRCLNIPARYVTGYLGDIRVPPVPDPMDFSAWFEVWLGSRWYSFDARHNQRRIGRIAIARGRDAVDVPITMVFGSHRLERFAVVTEELKSNEKVTQE